MKFGIPPWLKRAKDTTVIPACGNNALVKYKPVVDLSDAEEVNGWTAETLAAYHAESHARAMSVVAASMEFQLHGQHRPRWANSKYDPLHWRG